MKNQKPTEMDAKAPTNPQDGAVHPAIEPSETKPELTNEETAAIAGGMLGIINKLPGGLPMGKGLFLHD